MLPLAANVSALGVVRVHDGTFAGRIGWKAVDAAARPRDRGAGRRPARPTRRAGCATTRRDLLKSPEDVRDARLLVARGGRHRAAAPGGRTGVHVGQRLGRLRRLRDRGGGVLVLLLAAAFGWGALHALSPGHGKSMVAAYLVGTRGSVRDAVAARHDRDRHPHGGGDRARVRRARPVGLDPARAPVPVAQPGRRADGGERGAAGPARPAQARARAPPRAASPPPRPRSRSRPRGGARSSRWARPPG